MSVSIEVMIALMWLAGYLLTPAILIRGWLRWAQKPKRKGLISMFSLFGFSLASASEVLAACAIIYAVAIHGFRYYDPRLLRIFRTGLLLSLGVLLLGLIGLARPNSLRWYAPLSATATLAFWVAAASGE